MLLASILRTWGDVRVQLLVAALRLLTLATGVKPLTVSPQGHPPVADSRVLARAIRDKPGASDLPGRISIGVLTV